MRSEKEKQILEFVKKHRRAPLQRTPEWISMRRSVVGASDLAALVGMSPYGNFESVALKKSRIYSSSFSTPACWWGTIFEDVAVKYAEREFKTKIHGTNICVIPPEDSPLYGKHVVSPDGYGVVDFVKQKSNWVLLRERVARHLEPGLRVPMAALFEFKCPHRRHPKGFVPRHYLPQVWAGLDISPFANIGLFCDMVVRKCSKAEFSMWGDFDKRYHFDYDWGREIAWGVSGVFRRESSGGIIDYGAASAEEFDKMMGDAVEGQECRVVHSQLFASDLNDIDGVECFAMAGFFYWKVFRYDVRIVKRNPGFMERCTPLIYECLKNAHPASNTQQPRVQYPARVSAIQA